MALPGETQAQSVNCEAVAVVKPDLPKIKARLAGLGQALPGDRASGFVRTPGR
jgi:hypothetical protein